MTRTHYLLLSLSTLGVFSAGVASIAYAPAASSFTPGFPEPLSDEIPEEMTSSQPVTSERTYAEITDGCGPYFDGDCLNLRAGPGLEFPIVAHLRRGVVLAVEEQVERDGHTWYKVVFDEWLRYPERVSGQYYIAGDYARIFSDTGPQELSEKAPRATHAGKRIVVDISEQTLYAYDGALLVMETPVATGLMVTPTPQGSFTIFRKTPSRYMQGPIPGISQKEYDLPGVPWNLYFTREGAVIHGAYWHDRFGERWSNGCVNVPLAVAERLYRWADLGTEVSVRE